MQWILLSILSAILLGLYDLAKKSAVRNNAVPPVLLLNVAAAALIYLPALSLHWLAPSLLDGTPFTMQTLSLRGHGLLFLKSALVGASWTLALFALKNLPLSIATPIRATSPLWTTLLAVGCMGERPSATQWLGMATILLGFLSFSRVGNEEGIQFRKNRWVGYMVVATLLGSASALYDKYLLQVANFTPATVQAWFSIYLVIVMLPLALRWYAKDRKRQPFEFRWTILAIAIALLAADFLYFTAISLPGAMIAVISPVRRTSVIIPFVFGIVVLSEKNWKRKAMCVALILFGVLLICYR
jgi:bacterial/archaeal transporter family protein